MMNQTFKILVVQNCVLLKKCFTMLQNVVKTFVTRMMQWRGCNVQVSNYRKLASFGGDIRKMLGI